jgi:hypothetical protein
MKFIPPQTTRHFTEDHLQPTCTGAVEFARAGLS